MADIQLPPLPKAGPSVPHPPLDEPKTDPSIKAQRYDAARKRRPWWVGMATAAVTAVGATWSHVETRSAELQQERHDRITDVKRLESGQTETRADIRALYQSVMQNKPSERLERPVSHDAGPN